MGKPKLTERQIALWVRLQDLSVELHDYSYHIRFQKLRRFFMELIEIMENTKIVNEQTYGYLIDRLSYLSCEIIYELEVDRMKFGLSSKKYPKCAFLILAEIYNYKVNTALQD